MTQAYAFHYELLTSVNLDYIPPIQALDTWRMVSANKCFVLGYNEHIYSKAPIWNPASNYKLYNLSITHHYTIKIYVHKTPCSQFVIVEKF